MKPVTWQHKLTQMFGMDYRSLAFMRVFLGLTTLYDLTLRVQDLREHYCDDGVLPRYVVLAEMYQPYWISLYMLNGSYWFVAVMFGLHAACVALWTVGYRTWLLTPVCYVLQNSLNNRNILVTHGGDIYARCILFFGCFLPLGEVYSVDSVLRDDRRRRRGLRDWMVLNGGSVGLILQIACMYYSSFLHKSGPEWYPNGDATYLALRNDHLSYGLSHVLLMLPFSALRALTFAVWFWEGAGPLLFFSPWGTDWCRGVAVFGFVGMHAGFESCLRLDSFGPVCMSAVLTLLPTSFWDRLALWRRRRSKRRVVVKYDGECRNCYVVHRLLQTFLLIPDHEIEPLESLPVVNGVASTSYPSIRIDKQHAVTDTADAEPLWVVDCCGETSSDFEGIAVLLGESSIFWPLKWVAARVGRSRSFNSLFREFVHNHDTDDAGLPSADARDVPVDVRANGDTVHPHAARAAAAAVAFRDRGLHQKISTVAGICWQGFGLLMGFLVCGWLFGSIESHRFLSIENEFLLDLVRGLQMDQHWAMFAPRPAVNQWYYIMDGKLANGTRVELWGDGGMFHLQGRPYTTEKPDVVKSLKNQRWQKFFEGYNDHYAKMAIRLHWGRWFCRQWNRPDRHSGRDALVSYDVWMLSETQNANGSRTRLDDELFWKHAC